jgi:zinc/manganese transport system permease protein
MTWMLLPTLACLVIVVTLGWFGLHVLERGVIFVDLALAQVAALGTTYAVYLGHDPDSGTAFALALVSTLVGAAAFSAARLFEERVPQEAIIGIAYAVSAALGILMIHFADDPHGGEKLEHLLVGNIVWVQPRELGVLAAACGAVGLLHLVFRETFLAVSYRTRPVPWVALWDLLFYGSFGLALTAIVSVSGVLLVFSHLVIPAVVARLLVSGVMARLFVAWALGVVVSVAGVAVSYSHPTGPVIVALFGGALLVTLVFWAVRHAASPGRAGLQSAGAFAAVGAILYGFSTLPVAPEAHEADHADEAPAAAASEAADALRSPDAAARDTAAREAAGDPARADALAAAMDTETDPSVKLTMASALCRSNDLRGLGGLAALVAGDTPYFRREADGRLRALAQGSSPPFDPLAGPDPGAWASWVATLTAPPAGLTETALP